MSKVKTILEIEQERALKANFGNGISVAAGFDLGARSPLDARLTVKTIAERDAHVTGNRAYEGMLVYVEADTKTYQLINNAWEEFGFNEEKFEAGIAPLKEKDGVLENRIQTLEGLVVGGEGEGLQAIIEDVATNKADIAKLKVDSATKEELSAVDTAYKAADTALSGRIDKVNADLEEAVKDVKTDSANKATEALNSAKVYTDAEIVKTKEYTDQVCESINTETEEKLSALSERLEGEISNVEGALTTKINEVEGSLTTKIDANTTEISDIKDVLANKNNNTIVVNEITDITTANPEPKIGDMAYVISIKKAYIFKGDTAKLPLALPTPPLGWVLFDEITTEVDLVDFLKKADAEKTYRKLADKIAEADLHADLSGKINAKAEKTYVDAELAKKTDEAYVNTKVEEVVAPVRQESAANKLAISKEVEDRKAEITRVEESVSKVSESVAEVSTSLIEKEEALKAEDVKINNRFNKFVPVVGATEPQGTEAGHIWLEIL